MTCPAFLFYVKNMLTSIARTASMPTSWTEVELECTVGSTVVCSVDCTVDCSVDCSAFRNISSFLFFMSTASL